MSESVGLPPMPTSLDVEPAPKVAALIDAMLDAANPSFRKDFVCEVYVLYRREGTDVAGIFQVSPQAKTSGHASDDNISTGGFVGSGGWRPEDVSDPGNGPENR